NAVLHPTGLDTPSLHDDLPTCTGYGKSATCTPAPGSGTSNVAVSAALTGLTEGTEYHFRIVATNAGGTSEGADATFKTTTTPVKPTVRTEEPRAREATTATRNGEVNPNSFEVTECKFDSGPGTGYGNSATCTPAPGSGTSNVAVSAALTGLTEGTEYHFRIVATNAGGTSEGADATFKTTTTPVKPTV